MKAVILAGGKGTRLSPVLGEKTPKALADIGGMPLLEHQLKFLQRNGVKEVWLLLGYLGKEIEHFCKQKDWGVVLHYTQEEQPLGTAGALKQLEKEMKEDFFTLSGTHEKRGSHLSWFIRMTTRLIQNWWRWISKGKFCRFCGGRT